MSRNLYIFNTMITPHQFRDAMQLNGFEKEGKNGGRSIVVVYSCTCDESCFPVDERMSHEFPAD
jgi:hypothetical protein